MVPGRASGKKPCQISSVNSGSSTRSSSFSPCSSKRQSSTLLALAENRAKLTPNPVQVAPKGYAKPSRSRALVITCGPAATRASILFLFSVVEAEQSNGPPVPSRGAALSFGPDADDVANQ